MVELGAVTARLSNLSTISLKDVINEDFVAANVGLFGVNILFFVLCLALCVMAFRAASMARRSHQFAEEERAAAADLAAEMRRLTAQVEQSLAAPRAPLPGAAAGIEAASVPAAVVMDAPTLTGSTLTGSAPDAGATEIEAGAAIDERPRAADDYETIGRAAAQSASSEGGGEGAAASEEVAAQAAAALSDDGQGEAKRSSSSARNNIAALLKRKSSNHAPQSDEDADAHANDGKLAFVDHDRAEASIVRPERSERRTMRSLMGRKASSTHNASDPIEPPADDMFTPSVPDAGYQQTDHEQAQDMSAGHEGAQRLGDDGEPHDLAAARSEVAGEMSAEAQDDTLPSPLSTLLSRRRRR